jgi:hypothetical protein
MAGIDRSIKCLDTVSADPQCDVEDVNGQIDRPINCLYPCLLHTLRLERTVDRGILQHYAAFSL